MVVNITYESLFELLRSERTKEELQVLDKEFFNHVFAYLAEKKKIADQKGSEGLFGAEERSKTLQQLDSIKKVLNELYQLRERKIINLALHKSRTEATNVKVDMLLKEELELYKSLVELLNKYRDGIIKSLLSFKEVTIYEQDAITTTKQQSTKLIKFKTAVPSFVGPNLEVYGPFSEEDVANLPIKVAEAIINKGRGAEIKMSMN